MAPVQMFVEFQDCGHVAAAVAVIGRAPNCDQGFIEHVPNTRSEEETIGGQMNELVALHHKLVRTTDEVDLVRRVELKKEVKPDQNSKRTKYDARGAAVPAAQCRRRKGSPHRED